MNESENLGTNAGVDPAIVLDVAKIMCAQIGEFGLDFAEASAKLIEEYGPKIKPFLQRAWVKAQELIDAETTDPQVRDLLRRGVANFKYQEGD